MKEQNFRNHPRYVPGFHFVSSTLVLIILVLAVINLVHVANDPLWLYSGLMPLLMSVVLVLFFIYFRQFPLRAQDRAIRAEENFRFFVLTGKPLPAALTMNQVIALRFASDSELPSLAEKAVKENLSPKDIKMSISGWRADRHRA